VIRKTAIHKYLTVAFPIYCIILQGDTDIFDKTKTAIITMEEIDDV
jgi:hypothetical protein